MSFWFVSSHLVSFHTLRRTGLRRGMNVSAGISTTFKPTRNLILTNVAIKNHTDVFARTTLVLAVHGKGESFNIATMRVGALDHTQILIRLDKDIECSLRLEGPNQLSVLGHFVDDVPSVNVAADPRPKALKRKLIETGASDIDSKRVRVNIANPAGPSNPGPANAGPSNTGPANAGPSNPGPSNAGPSNAGPSNAGPSNITGVPNVAGFANNAGPLNAASQSPNKKRNLKGKFTQVANGNTD
ncbi:hypothetical protein F5051DRAFT_444685 [Lentinula edodes]|nr:hypothetical protein F5051DRAFT_444685 [Lentinula edodes]